MKVLGKNLLVTFATSYPDARSALAAWQRELEEATWTSPIDLKQRYPMASLVGGENVVFNIRGNKYRLHARLNFVTGIVIVIRVGTHSDYDRWSF